MLLAGNFLVHTRSLQLHTAVLSTDAQGAVVETNCISAAEFELGLRRIGPRCNLEIVFELPLISIEGLIDSGVNIFVLDPGKMGNSNSPFRGIIAHEIVALAGKAIDPHEGCRGIGSGQLHLDYIDCCCALV
jgi:hypothetical protein